MANEFPWFILGLVEIETKDPHTSVRGVKAVYQNVLLLPKGVREVHLKFGENKRAHKAHQGRPGKSAEAE